MQGNAASKAASISLMAVDVATAGNKVIVACKDADQANEVFQSVLDLTALMFRIVFTRERTVWFAPGGTGGWIRVRYGGREWHEGKVVLEAK